MLAKSPSAVGTRTVAYDGFMGLDTSRDLRAQDTGQEQHLAEVINAHCDWRGQIVKDPAASFRNGEMRVRHINFFATGAAAWVEDRKTFDAVLGALDKASDATRSYAKRGAKALAKKRPAYAAALSAHAGAR